MQNIIREAKQALRNQVCAGLKLMAPEERGAASAGARAILSAQAHWQTARAVLLFAPMPEELDVWPLLIEALSAGKQVALPRFVAETRTYEARLIRDPNTDLKVGHFGIREPASHCARLPSNQLDLILVPGVAFDLECHRLGRGRGYYDQLLGVIRGRTCGVAFENQVVDHIPVEPHDVRLECLLTPTRWIERKV
jgi:5-formyltetrahydrofolate cyclo-ligase